MAKIDTLRNLSDVDLLALISDKTKAQVLQFLDLHKDTRAWRLIVERLDGLGWTPTEKVSGDSLKGLAEIVKNASCFTDVLRAYKLIDHGANHKWIRKAIDNQGLDASHFSKNLGKRRQALPDEVVYCKNSSYSRSSLRRRVIRDKTVEHLCKGCGNPGVWRDQPLELELDHINGDPTDNRIENLRFLCSNCHKQTETFGAKNNRGVGQSGRPLPLGGRHPVSSNLTAPTNHC